MKTTVKREPATTNASSTQRVKQVASDPFSSTETAVDCRVLRSKYLALNHKINDERDDLARVDSDKFDSIIKEVEDLHKFDIASELCRLGSNTARSKLQKPREQVVDAEALLGIASTLATSVKSHSSAGITIADFISSLLSKFEQSSRSSNTEDDAPVSIKWRDIGLVVSPIFRQCNGFNTMVSLMSATELKQRKAVVRGKRSRPAEAARPDQVNDTGAEEKTDTDNNMAIMFEILRRKKRVRLEYLVLNRRSFAQTVENLFALSFLVKDGRVEITVDESGSHFVLPRNAPSASSVLSGEVTYKHFVFRFDFKDWKLMMDVVPEDEELMPNRETSVPFQVHSASKYTQATQSRTPIRKLSRNRGLVIQEETVVEDYPETDDANTQGTQFRRCKRRLT